MKTLDEIVNNYEEWSVFLDDRFGVRLAQFLTQEQLEKIGFKWNSDEPYPEPKEWTRENILVQLKEDVEFGFEKALDRSSASLMSQNLIKLFINYVMMQDLLILLRYEKESFDYFND